MPSKHFQLIVPNYDQTADDFRGPPLSYFRGGSPYDEADLSEPLRSKRWRGDDLVEDLRFKDDWRLPVRPGKEYFRDDAVHRESDGTGSRKTLTDELLDRGGWREHTDGNRISTTRGDCVEVIGGNHKLIVLGRVAREWDPAGLGDAGNSSGNTKVGRTRQEVSSGGHYNESTSTPGEVVSITWSAEHEDGTWTTVEQTDHGDVKSIFHGWIEEQYFGPSILTTVGVGTSTYPIEADRGGDPNPTSADGHPAKPPDIKETTFARSVVTTEEYEEVDSSTTALMISTKKHITKSQLSKESFESSHHSFNLHLLNVGMLMADTHLIKDACSGWRKNISIGALELGVSALGKDDKKNKGIGLSFNFKASATGIEIIGNATTLNLGLAVNVRIGPVVSITLGPETEITVMSLKAAGMILRNILVEMANAAAEMDAGATAMGLNGLYLQN